MLGSRCHTEEAGVQHGDHWQRLSGDFPLFIPDSGGSSQR